MANKQEVYLSKSKSGKCGFFSGNFMVSSLSDAEYEEFVKDPEKAKVKAQRMGFVLTNKEVKESTMNKISSVNQIKSNKFYVVNVDDNIIKYGPYDSEDAAEDKLPGIDFSSNENPYSIWSGKSIIDHDKHKKWTIASNSVSESLSIPLIQELLQLLEFETPGLKLGALKLDTQDNCIYVTIGGQKYKYTPNVADKAGQIYASVTGMAKHSTGKALAFLKKNATSEKLNEEIEELDEKVFPENHYSWFEVTAPMVNLERRGKIEHIAKGEEIGLRRATSSEGKYRVVTKKMGPTIIFSLDHAEFDQLMKKMKRLKGSL